MASATATAKPDPAPQGEAGNGREGGDERVGWRRRLTGLWPPGSRLGRLIILLNLIGLAVLICGALVLNELRRGLVEARIDSLTTQGEFIVKVLDETATVGDPAPALQAAEASDFLQILFIPRGQRARLFDANGQLVADSYAVADRVESTVLPPARRPGEKALLDPMQLKPKPDDRAISDLSREIAHALSGQRVAGMRRSETGRRVVSVSLPIQHVEAVLGVLTLEAGDVDQTIRAQRAAMIPFILIAIATMLTSSLLLNRLVARPVLRLAHAADRVRLAGEREISLPDIARRDDELGDLARALEDMTQSLYERMDATERFAADVAHEIRNPLTSIRSAVETLLLQRDEARAGATAGLGDLEHQPLGLVDQVLGRAPFARIGAGGDLAADPDQVPEQRPLADDVRVGADVGGGGRLAREARQVGEPAGVFGLALRGEVLGQRDRVGRFAAPGQFGDRREDLLVVAAVEVLRGQAVGDRVPGAVVEQQAAQHGLLGLDRVRRHAQRVRFGDGPQSPAAPSVTRLPFHRR